MIDENTTFSNNKDKYSKGKSITNGGFQFGVNYHLIDEKHLLIFKFTCPN
jgi:hypothetical protein